MNEMYEKLIYYFFWKNKNKWEWKKIKLDSSYFIIFSDFCFSKFVKIWEWYEEINFFKRVYNIFQNSNFKRKIEDASNILI